MRGKAGEKSFGARAAKKVHERSCRGEAKQCEARKQEWMRGKNVEWTEDFRGERSPVFDERLHKVAPTVSIRSESGFGGAEIAFEGHGCAVIERMGEGRGGMDPVEAVRRERERRKKWGACG